MEAKNTYETIIQAQLTALEVLLKKKDALLKKTLQQNIILEEKVETLEKENKKYSHQKMANSIFNSNLTDADKKKALAQIQKHIKAVDAAIEKLDEIKAV